MKLIKTELCINSRHTFTPIKLEQQDIMPTENKGWNMFEMWTSNTYVWFDYETN